MRNAKRRRRKKKVSLIQLEHRDITEFREIVHDSQDRICPICNLEIDYKDTTLDHQHPLNKSEPIGHNGSGLVRGTICRICNSAEGKIWNNFKRSGLMNKQMDKNHIKARAKWLRNLADYYESGVIKNEDGEAFVHPTEKPPMATMGKQLFNKLNKLYKAKYPNRKPLEVPKSIGKRGKNKGKWKITAKWEALLDEFQLS